jgi:hypothetical protein
MAEGGAGAEEACGKGAGVLSAGTIPGARGAMPRPPRGALLEAVAGGSSLLLRTAAGCARLRIDPDTWADLEDLSAQAPACPLRFRPALRRHQAHPPHDPRRDVVVDRLRLGTNHGRPCLPGERAAPPPCSSCADLGDHLRGEVGSPLLLGQVWETLDHAQGHLRASWGDACDYGGGMTRSAGVIPLEEALIAHARDCDVMLDLVDEEPVERGR